MVDVWVTAGNYDPPAFVNPLYAAFEEGVYPENVHILAPPNTREPVESVIPVLETLTQEERVEMEITLHDTPANPTDFKNQVSGLFQDIRGSSVAIDITGTPSVYASLLFQQAVADNVDADHVYHLDYRVPPDTIKEDLYPSIPRTAFNLADVLTDFKTEGTHD